MAPGQFAVHPATMHGLPALLDRLGEDGRSAAAHSDAHTTVPWTGEGLINLLAGGHDHVRGQVRSFFRAVDEQLAGPAATRVRDALTSYVEVDRANAAALEGVLPPGGRGASTPEPAAPTDAFRDIAEPTARLLPPPDHEGSYPHAPHWSDVASVGAVLRDAIWVATGVAASLGICDRAYDVYEWVLKPVVGDWAAIRACADVFDGLADAAGDMARNLDEAAAGTGGLWIGDAGSGCARYLSAAAQGLAAAEQPLRTVAAEYVGAANAMNELRNALASLLNDVADAAVMAAASGAVVALAGSTGAGLPIALVVGAFTLTLLYRVVRGLLLLADAVALDRAATAARGAALGSFGLLDTTVTFPTLPAPR